MRLVRLIRSALLLPCVLTVCPEDVLAYRPFDSTDPAVADPGEVEIELSPASYSKGRGEHTWIAPQLRLNYGFAQDWEIVLEGQSEYAHAARGTLVDNALSLKTIIKEGSLQQRAGPSVAGELGWLLPGVNDEAGMGAELAGIIGQKWSWGAAHFNIAGALSRDNRAELFLGTILEGPDTWTVRPVAEFVYEREFGLKEEVAILGGFIWQLKDTLAVDLAIRHAAMNGEPETEICAGITFAFSVR